MRLQMSEGINEPVNKLTNNKAIGNSNPCRLLALRSPTSAAVWRTSPNNVVWLILRLCPIMQKRDVIHKTGSMQQAPLSSDEDRANATGNKYTQIYWSSNLWFLRYASGQTDRQTDRHTDGHTDRNTFSLCGDYYINNY